MVRKGRVTINQDIYNTVLRMINGGEFKIEDICRATNLTRQTVSRLIKNINMNVEF